MSEHITGHAAAAREQSRQFDGRFGQQGFSRADGVDLDTPSETPQAEAAHLLTTPAMAVMDKRRGHALIPASAASWPALYDTEDVPTDDKIIQARYFGAGGQEWLVAEIDQESGEAFGHADLGTDYPEWGYMSLPEISLARHPGFPSYFPGVERDLDFQPTRFRDVKESRQQR